MSLKSSTQNPEQTVQLENITMQNLEIDDERMNAKSFVSRSLFSADFSDFI